MDSNINKPDRLESFIRENKDSFEEKMPNKMKNWKAIEQALGQTSIPKQKKELISPLFWKVASIFLLISCLALLFRPAPEPMILSQEINISPEFQQTEGYYIELIAHKETSLQTILENMPSTDDAMTAEMHQLDDTYNKLKEEWKVTQSDKLLQAMIQNLKLRVTYLNKQIILLERFKRKNHEYATSNL